MIKIAFFGTPKIGAAALQSLINHDDIEIVVVVTIPDKSIGRSHSEFKPSDVAKLAKDNNLNIIKTESINKDIDKLKEYEFDYILTCAFGQFLSDDVLVLPKKKALNIHGSLLPEGRGGAPLHWAIINGKEKTGISIMEMVSKMDAGDYYSQYELKIDKEDNVDILFNKMSNLILEKASLGLIEVNNGKKPTKQNNEDVTFWMNIKKEDARIDFSKPAKEIFNLIRGLDSKPGAWTKINNKIVKVHSSKIEVDFFCSSEPGRIIVIDSTGIIVSTGNGLISLQEVTFEGEKRMTSKDLINKYIINPKDKFL